MLQKEGAVRALLLLSYQLLASMMFFSEGTDTLPLLGARSWKADLWGGAMISPHTTLPA